MQVEYAEASLIGDREENQDRVALVKGDKAVLLIAIDGMGGHANGARAAALATETIGESFRKLAAQPILDPQGFLHLAIGRAHARLVELGSELRVDTRPRATCALCLVQDRYAYWAHMGDSRIYLLRQGQVIDRTRDHSHVELLLQEGLITEEEIPDHPMRNFVECCLGGNFTLPGMTVTGAKRLQMRDVLLACSDGFWSGLTDAEIAGVGAGDEALGQTVRRAAERAVRTSGPHSDNTSVVAVRVTG